MAKRKRLTPANPAFLAPAPEVKSALSRPPIADVAGDAASAAALDEMAQSLRAARAEGRMVIEVPLDDIATDHLVRDRVMVDGDEQLALIESIARRGQQTPVELVDLGEDAVPRYGLISGWRRVMALKELRKGLGAAYGTALGLLRRPREASEAYLAMIEENEIRAGLSHYERARIALKAVEQGAFPDEAAALATLYASGSKAKRSKIRSFMGVVRALDGALKYPALMGERLGLALAQALERDPGLTGRLQTALRRDPPKDAAAEQALIRQEMTPPRKAPVQDRSAPRPVTLRQPRPGVLHLEGPGVDADLIRDLESWLKARL